MRYFVRLGYNGAPFHGWQRQPNAVSVQERLEESLTTALRRPITVTGAGRTDAGVHARRMYAHFDIESPLCDLERLRVSLDRLSGPEIVVEAVLPVAPEAHARFDATQRVYKYFVNDRPSPFLQGLAWHPGRTLDYDAMNLAAELLLQTSDFTSFAKLHSDAKTNICRVDRAEWTEAAGVGHVFTISADRFLRNMVRAVVGTLVEVGRGKMTLDGFRRVIEQKDRCAAGNSMPAHALYLWDVTYPDEIFIDPQ